MRKYQYHSIDVRGKRFNEHTLIAEKVLGRKLPQGVQVHHVDGNGKNNNFTNLVICPSAAYHKLLHRRTDALNGCGNANWFRCMFCKKWDSPENYRFVLPKDQKSPRAEHQKCRKMYRDSRKEK